MRLDVARQLLTSCFRRGGKRAESPAVLLAMATKRVPCSKALGLRARLSGAGSGARRQLPFPSDWRKRLERIDDARGLVNRQLIEAGNLEPSADHLLRLSLEAQELLDEPALCHRRRSVIVAWTPPWVAVGAGRGR